MVSKKGKRIYTVIEVNSGSFYGNLSSLVPRVNNKHSVQERLDELESYRRDRSNQNNTTLRVSREQFNEDGSGSVIEQMDVYETDSEGNVKHERFKVLLDFV